MPIVLSSVPVPKPFTYGSLCSGIEAATVAWHPLGWRPAFFSEIDPFASAVLAHHWPDVPNLGDMTKHKDWKHAHLDLLVAGTPCQAFSVAGLRKGLEDARGNLTLTFIDIANQYDPDWIVWENVPGVLSSKDNAFGCFLGGLAGEDDALVPPGGKWANAGVVLGPQRTVAWRVLDAQYFGVAQRRRRVFVVASPRHHAGPVSVLLEWEGVRRDSPPSREKGEGIARTPAARTKCGGGLGTDMDCAGGVVGVQASQSGVRLNETIGTLDANYGSRRHNGVMVPQPTFWNGEQVTQTLDAVPSWPAQIAPTLNAHFGEKQGLEDQHVNGGCGLFVPATTHTLKAEGFDASEDGTGRGVPLVPVCFNEVTGTLKANGAKSGTENGAEVCSRLVGVPVAFHHNAQADQLPTAARDTSITDALTCSQGAAVAYGFQDDTTPKVRTEGSFCLRRDAGGEGACVMTPAMQVRRLLPVECERLQGFPDGHTMIPSKFVLKLGIQPDPDNPKHWAADGPRYKAIGNSMATPCMYFIGSRIQRFMEGTL